MLWPHYTEEPWLLSSFTALLHPWQAALIFIIFLVRKEASLSDVANIREASFGCMDDVEILGDTFGDMILMETSEEV
jgi:hypothetical protein